MYAKSLLQPCADVKLEGQAEPTETHPLPHATRWMGDCTVLKRDYVVMMETVRGCQRGDR